MSTEPTTQHVVAGPEQQPQGLQLSAENVIGEYAAINADLTRQLAMSRATITQIAQQSEQLREHAVRTISELTVEVERLRAIVGEESPVEDVTLPDPAAPLAVVGAAERSPKAAKRAPAKRAATRRR